MKLLQVNVAVNTTSTGRITEQIGRVAIQNGYSSHIAASNIGPDGSRSHLIKIGGLLDKYIHGFQTRAFDLHGFGSRRATEDFIVQVEKIDPDVVGLHNLHGYYLNIEVLFKYLKQVQKPVVWTFHDCWPFTGHCVYFDRVGCEKWKTECHNCPQKNRYPASYGLDRSRRNFNDKQELFCGLENLTIVTPSHWLKRLINQSFLQDYPVRVIHNGVDLSVFKPGNSSLHGHLNEIKMNKKMVLGVASTWDERKGLGEFIKLAPELGEGYRIVLVGLSQKQLQDLPESITGIARTENVEQLAALYIAADVFVNPTLTDNFPTTNIEALACGTPVITYNTRGSPESITPETGLVVEQRSIDQLRDGIFEIVNKSETTPLTQSCREHAVTHFNKEDRFKDYVDLYEKLLG